MPRLVTIFACLIAITGLAQNPSGAIQGSVASSSGVSLSAVKVSVINAGGEVVSRAESDAAGAFEAGVLAPGNYALALEASGFAPGRVEAVTVRPGESVTVPQVVLSPAASQAEAGEMVRIPVVDTERVQQADTILFREVRELPINRRNYLNLATLTPGVVEVNDFVGITDAPLFQAPQSGLSFGGNNGRGNVFWLDGGENYINTGGVRASISQEAVAEFHVDRANYSAEFGGGIGGIVNIVSKAGGDQFHGDVFGFLRDRSVQARNYFDPGKDAFTRSQVGGTLGGPIRKNKTFVFLAFERLQREETDFVSILEDRSIFSDLTNSQRQLVDFLSASKTPSLQLLAGLVRQGLVTTNFPATIALFNANSGLFPFREANTQGSVRIDHHFSDNHSAFVRFNAGNGSTKNSELEGLTGYSRGIASDFSDRTIMLNDTLVLSGSLVSESRLSVNRYLYNVSNCDTIGPSLDINGYGYFGKDWTLPSSLREWHGQAQQNFFYSTGRHSVRFGVDINPVHDSAFVQTSFGGRFVFGEYLPVGALYNQFTGDPNATAALAATLRSQGAANLIPALSAPITALQAFNLGVPAFYIQGFGDPSWRGWFKNYNFFVNDVIRVTPNLTLNAGLRYELEVNPSALPTDPNNVAPRIGFAWSPGDDRKTVIRGGYGLFYLRNNIQTAAAIDTQSGKAYNQVVVPLSGLPGTRNPATGLPYTSADIYQTLNGEGIIGKRAITAGDLAQFGIVPGPDYPFQFRFKKPTDWVNAYSQQASFEIERAIGGTSISVSYNFNRAAHLPRLRDSNVQYAPTGSPAQFIPRDATVGQQILVESAANSFYHALILQAARRAGKRVIFDAHYTFSKSIDEVTDLQFLPNNSLNPRQDRGLSTFDQRHRVVGSAIFELPGRGRWRDGWTEGIFGGFVLSPIVTANSGRPFNVLVGQDPTTRPLGAGRNIGHGPSYSTVDLRLARSFPLGSNESRSLEIIAEGFNMLNHTNFRRLNNVVGQVTVDQLPRPLVGRRGNPTDPLSFLSTFDPRQFQFALKIHF